MLAIRRYAVRHPTLFARIYRALETALRAAGPLARALGRERLERPFAGVERTVKGLLFDCRMCGTCALAATGMSCPMNCPKNLRNGPCGGVRDNGHCEVKPEMKCVWVQAWNGGDPLKCPDLNKAVKRDPRTNMRSAKNNWDFWTSLPEALHQVTIVMSDRGIAYSYRHMHGFGSHTFSLINAKNQRFWVKFHLKTQQGIKNLTYQEAEAIIGRDRESHQKDLYESIEKGDYPRWTIYFQIMPEKDVAKMPYNPFDLTKVWYHGDYPLFEVGVVELNRNPENYFADVEQAGFNPANIVPGIGCLDAINTYYGRGDLPLGVYKGSTLAARGSPYAKVVAERCPHDLGLSEKVPDVLAVYRRVLAAQPDGQVTMIAVGQMNNLVDLLRENADYVMHDFWNYERYMELADQWGLPHPSGPSPTGSCREKGGGPEGGTAKVITAIGMFYDLEDPNQFIRDARQALAEDGIFVAQLMCLAPMLEKNDVGNICHEHLEYYSLESLEYLFNTNGLEIFKVEENDVNGGSYRIYARHDRGTGMYRLEVP